MTRKNPALELSSNRASEFVGREYSNPTTNEVFTQQPKRFNHCVGIHSAANWVVVRLARQRAISLEHAQVLAEQNGIGGVSS